LSKAQKGPFGLPYFGLKPKWAQLGNAQLAQPKLGFFYKEKLHGAGFEPANSATVFLKASFPP